MIKEIEITISDYIHLAHERFLNTGIASYNDAYMNDKKAHKISPSDDMSWIFLNTTEINPSKKVLAVEENGYITHYILKDYLKRRLISIPENYLVIMNLNDTFMYHNCIVSEPIGDNTTYFNCVIKTTNTYENDNVRFFNSLFVKEI